ncbi:MAG: archease [Gammaproteobacteria bacterium]|nr:archease [Gammaproteobacteria bacterium]
MPKKHFEFKDHPADIKIKAYGKDLPELFINSALGMMYFLFAEAKIKIDKKDIIEVHAENTESLLVNWLAEILMLSDINNRAYKKFKILEMNAKKIKAEIGSGLAIAQDEIKAVTYHELSIKQRQGKYIATFCCDI